MRRKRSLSSSLWLAVRSKAEEERAEEQLRRLIGDVAYTVWAKTGRIVIQSKGFPTQWVIRRESYPPRLKLFFEKRGHCVGAAWGFKGPIPLADQVIALCLWIHADEHAVLNLAFPEVKIALRGRSGKKRAEDWDTIIGEAPVREN